jgi:hypothetical protein
MTKLTRTDCERDNKKVRCPNASTIGFGLTHCKRGYWLLYQVDNFFFIGRAIGRVVCEGRELIEVAQASPDMHHAYIRWIEPEQVNEIRLAPPRHVFDFFAQADWKPETVFAQLEHGVYRT